MSPARLRIPICLFAALAPAVAFANGVNPPQLKTAVAVTAVCHEKSDDRRHTIYRATIEAPAAASNALKFRNGAVREDIPLRALQSVELTGAAPDGEGFVAATLLRRGSAQKDVAALRVRESGAALRLSGYGEGSARLAIDLAACARIEILEPQRAPNQLTESELRTLPKSKVTDVMRQRQ